MGTTKKDGNVTGNTKGRESVADTTEKIKVVYLLSQDGQRECLRRRCDAAQCQVVLVPPEHEDLGVELVTIGADGPVAVFVGGADLYRDLRDEFRARAGGGKLESPGTWTASEVVRWASTVAVGGQAIQAKYPAWEMNQGTEPARLFDAPQVEPLEVLGLLTGESLRRDRVRVSLADAGTAVAEGNRAAAPAKLAAEAAVEAGRVEALDHAVELELAAAARETARQSKRVAEQTEAGRWCSSVGGHLAELASEGLIVGSMRVYWTERLAVERPGWTWARGWAGPATDFLEPRNVSPEDLELLRTARDLEPEAELQWASKGEAGTVGGIREMVCVAEYLDRTIVLRHSDCESK